jgi:hypothetical protein
LVQNFFKRVDHQSKTKIGQKITLFSRTHDKKEKTNEQEKKIDEI